MGIPLALSIWGFPKIRGTFFGGAHSKDYNILGSILGPPDSGKLPYTYISIYKDPNARVVQGLVVGFLGLVWGCRPGVALVGGRLGFPENHAAVLRFWHKVQCDGSV